MTGIASHHSPRNTFGPRASFPRCSRSPRLSLLPHRSVLRSTAALVAVAVGIACRAASAEPPSHSAAEIVRKALRAEHATNVRGKELVSFDPPGNMTGLMTTREVMRTSDGWCMMRWEEPRARRGSVAVDDGTWTRSYAPGDRSITRMRSRPHPRTAKALARQARLVLRNYRAHVVGREQMAGRECYIVHLEPVYPTSHEITLWVDARNYFILSRQENNAQGHTIVLTMFRSIEYPEHVSHASLQAALPKHVRREAMYGSEVVPGLAALRKRAGFELCVPYAMPGGYELDRCELMETAGGRIACLRYTDGLQDLTLYESRAPTARSADFHAVAPQSDGLSENLVQYASGPMNFTLIGRMELAGLMAVTHTLNPDREQFLLDNVARSFKVPLATLTALRIQGLGLDTIDALVEVAKLSRHSLSSLVDLARQGFCWRQIAAHCKVDGSRILGRVRYFEAR